MCSLGCFYAALFHGLACVQRSVMALKTGNSINFGGIKVNN
jgi:hypothetical protein